MACLDNYEVMMIWRGERCLTRGICHLFRYFLLPLSMDDCDRGEDVCCAKRFLIALDWLITGQKQYRYFYLHTSKKITVKTWQVCGSYCEVSVFWVVTDSSCFTSKFTC
jgi:hypothetical protein